MNLLLLSVENVRLGRFAIAAGDRERSHDVARVPEQSRAQIVIIVDSGVFVGVWCPCPHSKLFAPLLCRRPKETVTGVGLVAGEDRSLWPLPQPRW